MGTVLNLLTAGVLPALAGYAVCVLVLKRTRLDPWIFVPASLGLGLGILAQWMLALSIVGVRFTRFRLSLPLLVLAAAGIFYVAIKKKTEINAKEPPPVRAARWPQMKLLIAVVVFVYVVGQIYFAFWRALLVPICTWDALFVIAAKAKSVFYEDTLILLTNYGHAAYPLQVPLTLAWVAFNLGTWSEQLVKIVFPVIFTCCALVHYGFLRRLTDAWWALLGTGLLVSSNFLVYHATIAYRDIFMMYSISTTVIFLMLAYETGQDRLINLAGLFAGLALFTKLEAVGYFLVLSLGLVFLLSTLRQTRFRGKMAKFARFVVPGLVIFLSYSYYRTVQHVGQFESRLLLDAGWHDLSRAGTVLARFIGNLFLGGNWGILWFLLLVSLFVRRSKITNDVRIQFLLLVLGLYFGLYFFIAWLTPNFLWLVGPRATALSRVFLHLFPLCPILIVLLNYPREDKT